MHRSALFKEDSCMCNDLLILQIQASDLRQKNSFPSSQSKSEANGCIIGAQNDGQMASAAKVILESPLDDKTHL